MWSGYLVWVLSVFFNVVVFSERFLFRVRSGFVEGSFFVKWCGLLWGDRDKGNGIWLLRVFFGKVYGVG